MIDEVGGFLQEIRLPEEVFSRIQHGTTFTVHDHAAFSKVILPTYFKHGNIASFIRQLNMYDFHKHVSLMSCLTEQVVKFSHIFFLREGPGLLVEIKRKLPKVGGTSLCNSDPEPVLEYMFSSSQHLNKRHCSLVGMFRQLKQMQKSIRQGLSELRLWLAEGVIPDNTVGGSSKGWLCGLEETPQSSPTATGEAEVVAANTRALRETRQQMARWHSLYIKELRVALQGQRRRAKLNEQEWKVRIQSAEQELDNRELEYAALSKQLQYQRACNARKGGSTVQESPPAAEQ